MTNKVESTVGTVLNFTEWYRLRVGLEEKRRMTDHITVETRQMDKETIYWLNLHHGSRTPIRLSEAEMRALYEQLKKLLK